MNGIGISAKGRQEILPAGRAVIAKIMLMLPLLMGSINGNTRYGIFMAGSRMLQRGIHALGVAGLFQRLIHGMGPIQHH